MGLPALSCRLGAVVDADFGQDRFDVVADGLGADGEFGGDAGVAVAGGDQREDFSFVPAQSVGVGEDVRAAAAAACQSPLTSRWNGVIGSPMSMDADGAPGICAHSCQISQGSLSAPKVASALHASVRAASSPANHEASARAAHTGKKLQLIHFRVGRHRILRRHDRLFATAGVNQASVRRGAIRCSAGSPGRVSTPSAGRSRR